MELGISSPIVTLAGDRPAWERDATVADLVEVAETADRLGYDFLSCPEHVAVPPGARGERFYDPLATLSYLAARTQRIRLLTSVLILPLHHPLELIKRYGTLDHLSGGRVVLGLGVGNLREEFDALDVGFYDRGARADEALRILRAARGQRSLAFDGEHHRFDELVLEPGFERAVPLWIGGHSEAALRRAIDLGDGWAPAPPEHRGPTPDEVAARLAEAQPPAGFDVVLPTERFLDPLADPGGVREVLDRAAQAGATRCSVRVLHRSKQHYLEQLSTLAESELAPRAG